MNYFKVEAGVVVQVQPNPQDGFIETSDFVVCGMMYNNGVLTNPVIVNEPTQEELKLIGVDFQGTMVSATAQDMWGLSSVRAWIVAGNDVNFKFDNGNVVTLTALNLADFEAVWIPFRASFF